MARVARTTADEIMHDRDAEAALLGSALLCTLGDAEGARAVAALPLEIWYTETHRQIAQAIVTCVRAETLDSLSLRRAGAPVDILRMMVDAQSWSLVSHHVETLRACLSRRVAAERLSRATQDLADGADPGALIAQLASSVTTAADASALPDGYYLAADGSLWRTSTREDIPDQRIAPVLVSLVARAEDVTTGSHVVTLRWRIDGRLHTRTLDRATVAVSRDLARHGAAVGLPVTSESARGLVAYIAAAEEACGVPVTRSARQTGWHGSAYLRGMHRHGDDCPEYMRDAGGHDDLVAAVTAAGQWDAWRTMALEACTYPVVALALLTSCTAPLLPLIGAPSWALHLGSQTSGGKTSAGSIALSVWGDPQRLLATWDATPVALELRAAALSGLPMLIDDTQRAARPDVCADAIYTLTQGVGRARGGTGGAFGASLRPSLRWSTLPISTGEGPLPMPAHAGGARARVIHIADAPWGRSDPAMGETVRRLVGVTRAHHGHLGERIIARLVALSADDRATLRADWQQATMQRAAQLAVIVPTAPALDRVAQYLGALDVAGAIVSDELGTAVDWLPARLVESIAATMGEIDRARAALEHVYAWTVGRVEQFGHAPHPQGLLGYAMPRDGHLHDLAYLPGPLSAELARAGYDADAIVSTWQRRGWLICDDGRQTSRATIGSTRTRCLRLSPVALALLHDSPARQYEFVPAGDEFSP